MTYPELTDGLTGGLTGGLTDRLLTDLLADLLADLPVAMTCPDGAREPRAAHVSKLCVRDAAVSDGLDGVIETRCAVRGAPLFAECRRTRNLHQMNLHGTLNLHGTYSR